MVPLGVAELERLAARGWRAPEEELLGGWLLRAGAGFTGRANSVLVVGDPPGGPGTAAAAKAVGAVRGWYAARGLPPVAQLPFPGGEAADDAFAAAGWRADSETLVLTAPLGEPAPPGVPVQLAAAPDDAWLAGYRYRGAELPPSAVPVLRNACSCVFASVRPHPGPIVAVARGVLTDGWLGVTAVTVDASHRRAGLATAVMAALSGWARARGAHSTYLQVAADNQPARELYRRAGFTAHHRYHYRRLPG